MDSDDAWIVEPDVLEKVLAHALSSGGRFAEVFVEERSSVTISLDDRNVEELSSGRDRGAGIRVVSGATTGFAHTADLSERGLVEAARAASAVAREREAGSRRVALGGAPTRARAAARAETSGKADKVDVLVRVDDAARSYSKSVVQVRAGYGESARRILVANSDGHLALAEQVRTRVSAVCVASGDTGLQTGSELAARCEGFELFRSTSPDEIGHEAARRAVTKLSARAAPTGVLPVVIKGGSGGILFHEACGHGLEADHIVRDSSVYSGRIGETVASPLVTLVDDGSLDPHWGSYTIDDEGHPARRNVLIENGVLVDYMWDMSSGDKLGRSSTGNGRRQSFRHLPMVRMTNTFLLAGDDDPDEILAQTPRGLYVARLGGGSVNTATGDFVFGMTEAYLIENGRITEPLRNANLIGNGPQVLSRIDAVGDDLDVTSGTCGKDGQSVPVGCGQPTLRVTGVTVGGTAGG